MVLCTLRAIQSLLPNALWVVSVAISSRVQITSVVIPAVPGSQITQSAKVGKSTNLICQLKELLSITSLVVMTMLMMIKLS